MFEKIWSKLNESKVVKKLRDIGDVLRYAIASVALGVVAVTDFNLVYPFVLSVLVAQGLVEVLKKTMNYTPWGDRPDGHDDGFPSGHVAGAFSGAWLFYFVYGWEVAVIPLFLGAIAALSRVLAKKHNIVQVTVSIILTYVIAEHFLI